MRFLVTGAAGLMGSHTVDRLLAEGHEVIGVDSYITGRREFLAYASANPRFTLIVGDLFDFTTVIEACEGVDAVFHFAANTDVRYGTDYPRRDLDQNVIVTWNILEAMRRRDIKTILTTLLPTPEDGPLPIQTSLQSASKLAAEAFISAYAQGYGIRALIFRFAAVVGERCTHGHLFDFCRQLHAHPDQLHVLGDGAVRRSYIDVADCVDAMLLALHHPTSPVEVFNVGSLTPCELTESIGWIASALNIQPAIEYSGPGPAWVGSCPVIYLDCTKLHRLGWQPKLDPEAAVRRTVHYLAANPWLLEPRA
ncbi:MAG: nucleoside-diphosphate sugar epimerase [Acidobacteriia bacterium 12-62-4]|nr:MAG: nucleoside-diphosphate sugar epimerase [Acidobacteriia bacterium 12-62-4]